MKFLDNLFHHKHDSQASFSSISGYDDVKNIINRVLSEKVLSKTSRSIARYIGANVWKNEGDMRDVISIGKFQEIGRSSADRADNGDYDEIWNGKERGGKSEQ